MSQAIIIPSVDLRKRRGLFRVDRSFVECALSGSYEHRAAWNAVFTDFIVTRCESQFADGSFDYVGFHPQFDEVEEGVMSPAYFSTITRKSDANGIVTFTATLERNALK